MVKIILIPDLNSRIRPEILDTVDYGRQFITLQVQGGHGQFKIEFSVFSL